METSEWNAVIGRVAALEKQNRRLKQAGASVMILLACVVLMAQVSPNRTIEASKLTLRDTDGTARAILEVDGDATNFSFFDSNGVRRVSLLADSKASVLTLADAKGAPRSEFGTRQDEAWMAFFDRGTKERVRLLTSESKSRNGLFLFEDGDTRSSLTSSKQSGALTLFGANGDQAFLHAGELGSFLQVVDGQGFQTMVGSSGLLNPLTGGRYKTSAASLVLFSGDKVLWKAP